MIVQNKFAMSSYSLAFLPCLERVNAILSLSETEGDTKLLSAPKIVVLNKQEATIVQDEPTLLIQKIIQEGGQVVDTPVVTPAVLSLKVKPTVTNDESVLMDISVQNDVPRNMGEGQAVAKRTVNTQVIVDSGSTLVIGGAFRKQERELRGGIPLLRDIPIIGYLFGTKVKESERTELLVFISPRILNVSRAGLGEG